MEFLTLGVLGALASDVAHGLIQLHGTFQNGTVVDLGWAVFYGGWGAAALYPAMTDLTKPVTRQSAEVSPVRLTLLMLASLIAPVLLFVESFRFRGGDLGVIAVFSALLYLLVLSRLSDAAASHRRAAGRERAVRQAGVSMVAAVTVERRGPPSGPRPTLCSAGARAAMCCSRCGPAARFPRWPQPPPSRR